MTTRDVQLGLLKHCSRFIRRRIERLEQKLVERIDQQLEIRLTSVAETRSVEPDDELAAKLRDLRQVVALQQRRIDALESQKKIEEVTPAADQLDLRRQAAMKAKWRNG